MTSRRTLVLGVAAVALAGFGAAAYLFTIDQRPQTVAALPEDSPLIRPHSPVLGPANAPVTIVEFFDPACEACRAFHPIVKQIMDAFPGKVRVVLRYAAFHPTSAEAIAILETARLQNRFLPVLEALLEAQPVWAPHGRQPASAWPIAARAGLDVERAQRDRLMPHIVATLNQDAADVVTVGVRQTPTFFVNGKPLREFGAQQLFDLVKSEVNAQ
jgi:protein-disulfide isomerase